MKPSEMKGSAGSRAITVSWSHVQGQNYRLAIGEGESAGVLQYLVFC